jgi:ABC-2 type transport system permease protein
VQIPLPDDLSEDGLKRGMDAGFKRFASGYLKGVALMAPEAPPYMQPGMPQGQQYSQLFGVLSTNLNVERTQLTEGHVPAGVESLVVVDPTSISQTQLFAIDQFLMQGGTVIVSAAPFAATLAQQSLFAAPRETGVGDWLTHHGIDIEAAFVLDLQNASFPVPVTRQVGGFSFQEVRMLDYPFFVDIRGDGLNDDSAITADLPQLTMPWATPITVNEQANAGRGVTTLLESSAAAWRSASTDVMPRIDDMGLSTFAPEGETGVQTLGVMLEGEFTSYFADKENPLLVAARAEAASAGAEAASAGAEAASAGAEASAADADAADDAEGAEDAAQVIGGVIDRSPESAKLIVFASNDFLADQTLAMIGSAEGSLYANSLQLLANAVDFSLADQSLLSIRSRGHFNRTLPPLETDEQRFWEYLNYVLALLGVLGVFLYYRRRAKVARVRYQSWLSGEAV